jgi:hypothetical protein
MLPAAGFQAPALERCLAAREVEAESVRASIARWFGLARPADAFRLSQRIFTACAGIASSTRMRRAIRILAIGHRRAIYEEVGDRLRSQVR